MNKFLYSASSFVVALGLTVSYPATSWSADQCHQDDQYCDAVERNGKITEDHEIVTRGVAPNLELRHDGNVKIVKKKRPSLLITSSPVLKPPPPQTGTRPSLVIYDKTTAEEHMRVLTRRAHLNAVKKPPVCHDKPVTRDTDDDFDGFSISVEGEAVEGSASRNEADIQRCTDLALQKADIQMRYDSLAIDRSLNVTAWPGTAQYGEQVQFQGYSNYQSWIDRAEVRLFKKGTSTHGKPLATLPLNKMMKASWKATGDYPENLIYVIRVYDKKDRFDETTAQELWLVKKKRPTEDDRSVYDGLLAGYGENRLVKQSIPVRGGTLTVNGRNVMASDQISVMGRPVPVNKTGKFVTQQIMPDGEHTVEISVLNDAGVGDVYLRYMEFKRDDWFYVGIADMTIGQNNTSGPAELVTDDDQHYDDDIYVDGRIAFYVKGKWRGKYKITGSADTGEEAIENIFSNFADKDPRRFLRQLDEEDVYPVYGDDSTITDDAPTQGKFYFKVEDDKSHLMWGNFKQDLDDTELSRVNRALYGGRAYWKSARETSHGERKTEVQAFVADPGTLAAREDFRGTGGSLYYLEHQDITRGAERVQVEIRDKDSGQVLSVTQLVAGQDYDIDSLQGRILLTKPLPSTADDGLLVNNNGSGLSGHYVYLVADYEYTPGFGAVDQISAGGRISHWVGDHVKLGITSSHQEQTGGDQDLYGADVTVRYKPGTYVKIEGARTEGTGIGASASFDGGYTFGGVGQDRTADIKASAVRAEAGINFEDVNMGTGKASLYAQHNEAGFSAPGQLTEFDTDKFGGRLDKNIGDKTTLAFKFDSEDQDGGTDKHAVEVNVGYKISDRWQVSSGLRGDDVSTTAGGNGSGERADMTVQVDFDSGEDWNAYGFAQATLTHDDTRARNHRAGIGGKAQVNDRLSVNGEVSAGDGGFGASLGTDYRVSDRRHMYLTYALDTDRTDQGTGSRNGVLTTGVRNRFSDTVSVYSEEQYHHGQGPAGLTQSYGVDYVPNENWTFGASTEQGRLEDAGTVTDRVAASVSAGYQKGDVKYGSNLEYRKDKVSNNDRTTWLMRNNLAYQASPDWRTQVKFDFALSDDEVGDFFDGDFIETVLGFAYRPVDNDKLNALFKYTYFADLAPAGQVTSSGTSSTFQQRSHVLSADTLYDLTSRLTLGAKYAMRLGEIREARGDGDWFDSLAQLYIGRLDWHVVRNWDALIEARMLDVREAEDRRIGALIGISRHVNDHLKIGAGYNFTDFSDDLTDLDYDSKGYYINIVGKM